jgi:hypothetical protein
MGGFYMYDPDNDGNKESTNLKEYADRVYNDALVRDPLDGLCPTNFTTMYPAVPQLPYTGIIFSLPSVIFCTSKYFPFFKLIKRYRKSK